MYPHAVAEPALNVARATRYTVVAEELLNRLRETVMPLIALVVVSCKPDATSLPSVGIVAVVLVSPAELAVSVAEPRVKLTLASTSQSPGPSGMLVTFA